MTPSTATTGHPRSRLATVIDTSGGPLRLRLGERSSRWTLLYRRRFWDHVGDRLEGALDDKTLESLARELHRLYLDGAASRPGSDPAMAEWEELPESLRASNRAHAAALVDKVGAIGCLIVPGERGSFRFTDDEIEHLAILEHERWVAERLAAGWRPGPERDPIARTSPNLISWAELGEEMREVDRVFVRQIPEVLAAVGLSIRR